MKKFSTVISIHSLILKLVFNLSEIKQFSEKMKSVEIKFLLINTLCFGVKIFAAPADSKQSLIVSSTESSDKENLKEEVNKFFRF